MARGRYKKKNNSPDGPAEDTNADDVLLEHDLARFDSMKHFVAGVVIAVFGAASTMNDISTLVKPWSPPGEELIFYARIILFVELIILTLRWIVATHSEFEMWSRWLKNPFQKQQVYGGLFSLALVMGLLLSFPHKVMFVTALMAISLLVNHWTQWLANDHFRRALQRTQESDPVGSRLQVLKAMEHYWLKRPQMARLTAMMLLACLAFSFALAGCFQPEPQRHRYELGAYVITIVNILFGESMIAWWRHKRNADISLAFEASLSMDQPRSVPINRSHQGDALITRIDQPSTSLAAVVFAVLPVVSFIMQYVLSLHVGTQQIMLRHLTVMAVDWVFVPFNFLVIGTVEWHRGIRLYMIFIISVALNVLTIAFWQRDHVDPGHMISGTGNILPAGWVHLVFSISEMVLLLAFVFCHKPEGPRLIVSGLAIAYFIALGVCGYVMHHGFIISDLVASISGVFLILAAPWLMPAKSTSLDHAT